MRSAAAAFPRPPPAVAALPLPLMVVAFCLLWSSAFAVAKVAVADCPPLLLLTARFLVAGVLMLGIAAVSRMPWTLSRRDVASLRDARASPTRRSISASATSALREISAGLSALIASSNPILTAVLAAFLLGERMTWRKAVGLAPRFRRRRPHRAEPSRARLAISLRGILLTRSGACSRLLAARSCSSVYAPKDGLWIGNGVQSLAAGIAFAALCAQHSRASATSCRPGGCLHPSLYLGLARLDLRFPALVLYSEGVGCDGRKLLPLPDAAARHAVRLAVAWRARGTARSARDCSGRARDLSRDEASPELAKRETPDDGAP